MAFIKLGQLVSPALKRAGVNQQANTAIALERAGIAIRDFLGEHAAAALQPVYVKYRTLTIASLNASAAMELGMIEEELLQFVNKGLSRKMVDRVRIIT